MTTRSDDPGFIDLISSFLHGPPDSSTKNVPTKSNGDVAEAQLAPPSNPLPATAQHRRDISECSADKNNQSALTSAEDTLPPETTNIKCFFKHDECMPSVRVVIFSKDRPWQLQQLLRSMKLPFYCINDRYRGSEKVFLREVDIYVILRASSSPFTRGYDKVIKEYSNQLCFHADGKIWKLHFLNENEWEVNDTNTSTSVNEEHLKTNAFSQILEHVLTIGTSENANHVGGSKNNISNEKHDDDGIILFLTDDCLLLEPLEVILSCAIGALRCGRVSPTSTNEQCNSDSVDAESDSELIDEPLENLQSINHGRESTVVFNFLSRLHPGISWSQTRDAASPSPRNKLKFLPLKPYFRKLSLESDKDGSALPKALGYLEFSSRFCDGVYLFDRECGAVEWNYPFDLSGGVYHHRDVLALIKCIRVENRVKSITGSDTFFAQEDGLSHPNIFEMACNQALNETLKQSTLHSSGLCNSNLFIHGDLTAIPTHPFMVILAINRVQDVFQAPLASSGDCQIGISSSHTCMPTTVSCDLTGIDASDPSALLQLLDEHYDLDVERYQLTAYNTSHIGDLFIQREGESTGRIANCNSSVLNPKISILIPVHHGPPHAASHSIASIISEIVTSDYTSVALLSPMQIVIVDDRCEDGSIDAMLKSSKNLVSSFETVSLLVNDHRNQNAILECHHSNDKDTNKEPEVVISIDIVSSPRKGIACALNEGIEHCQAELVARMDADDISASQRLFSQVRFMQANPNFSVVGTSSVLFSDDNAEICNRCLPSDHILPYCVADKTRECICNTSSIGLTGTFQFLRSSLTIADPGFLSWAMYFSCPLIHPSACFRKNDILKLGYQESNYYCEDYDLWLRLTQQNCRSMICLPRLGLWHRKHNESNSSKSSASQKAKADLVCFGKFYIESWNCSLLFLYS